jgi:metal-responsive CopG/Arc/MetJ family transcriptional regulator
MACKDKITISMDGSLLSDLDRTAEERHVSRSALIEEALHVWRRERLEADLARGYREMAGEDRATAEANLRSGVESLD